MRFKELSGRNFGRFSEIDLTFGPGLNLICGPNGSGKSTIASMMKALLYTFPPSRKNSVADNERKKMTPWSSSEEISLRGIVEDKDQKEYIIERSFGKSASKDRLFVFSGPVDVTEYFYPEPGENLLGTNEGGFSRTAFFPQSRVVIDKNEDLTKKLINLVSSGDENISPSIALAVLDAKRKSLDNARGGGKIPELLKERELLLSRKEQESLLREKNLEKLERLKELEREIDEAERRLAANKGRVSDSETVRGARLYQKYMSLKSDLEKSGAALSELKSAITAGDGIVDAAFVAALEDEVRGAEGKFALVKNLDAHVETQKKELAEKEMEMEGLSGLLAGEGADSMVSRLNASRADAEKKIAEFGELEIAVGEKTERIAALRAVHREFSKLSDEEGKEILELFEAAQGSRKNGILASFLFLLCALFSAAGAFFLNRAGYDRPLIFILGGVSALFLAVFILWIYLRLKKYDAQMEDLTDILSVYSVEDIHDFERLFSESRREKYEIDLLEKEIRELNMPERERAAAVVKREMEALDRSLDRLIRENRCTGVGELLSAVAEAKEKRLAVNASKKRLFESEAELARSVDEANFLAETAVMKARALKNECETLQDVEALIADCREIFSGIRSELLKEELLEEQLAGILKEHNIQDLKDAYDLTLVRGLNLEETPDVKNESEDLFRRLSDLKAERSAITAQIREPKFWGGDLAALDEMLADVAERIENLKIEYEATLLAIERIGQAYGELEKSFAPKLIGSFEEKMEAVTGERPAAMIGKEFEIRLLRDNAFREIGYFSRGMTDVCYFALRLSLTQISEGEGKIFPLILDDAFSELDDQNFSAAMRLLEEESRSRQIIFFTCQKRDTLAFSERGAKIISI